MGQVFGPSANTIARFSIIVVLFLAVGGLCALDAYHRSPYVRFTQVVREQPIPFSHKHHVNMGIDCRYCHTSVEESSFANVPPTRICMNCHTEIYNNTPLLAKVHESWESGQPISWNRVNDLPDYVYFNHSIHVNKGIGCKTCHGPIDQMPLTWREHPLFMKWCLECHRDPAPFMRPREEVFNMAYEPEGDAEEQGRTLLEEYKVDAESKRLTDCWICHR